MSEETVPYDVTDEKPVKQKRQLSESDVYQMKSVPSGTVTQDFETDTEILTFTITNKGKFSANEFYKLSQLIAEGGAAKESQSFPLPGGETVVIPSGLYLGGLRFMAEVCLQPDGRKMPIVALVKMGETQEIGPKVMDRVFKWAVRENGLSSEDVTQEAEERKNDGSGAASQ